MYRTVGRRPTHNELVFKFVERLPLLIENFSLFCVHFLLFHRSFVVGRSIVFVLNVAVVLRGNARVTTCNCCVAF
jgi:hypothetical protein